MLLVILAISIVICIVGIVLAENLKDEEIGFYMFCISGLVVIGSVVALICCGISLNGSMIIDDKIELYESENTKIEESVATVVNNYMKYEQSTFEKCTGDNAITMVNLYPELKSDELVKSQLNLYVRNNERIKELKEEKLDYIPLKWWVYFGGK